MSDPEKPQQPEASAEAKAPEATAPAAKEPVPAAAKPAAPKAVEPPPPPEPGVYGTQLAGTKTAVEHLGKDATGAETLRVAAADLLTAATFLRDACQFDLLVSVTGVDWKDRLESVYHLYSTHSHERLTLKVTAVEEHVPSITPVYPAANWHERESFDLIGIVYDGHPNLARILMPSDWIGHPLRKDYKVTDPRLVWNER